METVSMFKKGLFLNEAGEPLRQLNNKQVNIFEDILLLTKLELRDKLGTISILSSQ